MLSRVMIVALLAMATAPARSQNRPAPVHIINLDLEPALRWAEVVPKYQKECNVTLNYMMGLVGKGTLLHPLVSALRDAVLKANVWKPEHLAEMKAIAELGGWSVESIHFVNLFYEYGTLGAKSPSSSAIACTSIVAENDKDEIFHARNQDYSLPALPNITVQVEFQRKGRTIYKGNTFVGYVGLPTGMRVGAWSVSANSRFNDGGANLVESIRVAGQGGKTIGIFIREMCEDAHDYAHAIRMLNDTLIIAPAYYTVAGTSKGEGAVVTRGRQGPDQSKGQGIWTMDMAPANWYRLETNFDHWTAFNDGRRPAANKMMQGIGQKKIDLVALDDVLSTKPVLASDTVYSAYMRPKDGHYHTIIRL